MKNLRIEMEAPRIVSQMPFGMVNEPTGKDNLISDWGLWQYPGLYRAPGGGICAFFHKAADRQAAYGTPSACFVSYDDGDTWEERPDQHGQYVAVLPNGDLLKGVRSKISGSDGLGLPEPVYSFTLPDWRGKVSFYNKDEIVLTVPMQLLRYKKGGIEWETENPVVKIPGAVCTVRDNVLYGPFFEHMRIAPDGSLWGVIYHQRNEEAGFHRALRTMIIRSTDDGHTWDFLGEIPFHTVFTPDQYHPNQTCGFNEADVLFLDNGDVMCVARADGLIDDDYAFPAAVLYKSYSSDKGRTWSQPEVFDPYGVWPTFLKMGRYSLFSYGRPGVYLRISDDEAGRVWSDRFDVGLSSGDGKTITYRDSCGYTDMLALDDRTALLIYTDFAYPDEEGRPRKSVLTRKLRINYEPQFPLVT